MKELRSKYKEVISYKTANVYQLPGTYPLFPGGFAQQGKTDFLTCVLQNIPNLQFQAT